VDHTFDPVTWLGSKILRRDTRTEAEPIPEADPARGPGPRAR